MCKGRKTRLVISPFSGQGVGKLFLEGQRVNILDVLDHTVSLATTQVYCCGTKAATQNMSTNERLLHNSKTLLNG